MILRNLLFGTAFLISVSATAWEDPVGDDVVQSRKEAPQKDYCPFLEDLDHVNAILRNHHSKNDSDSWYKDYYEDISVPKPCTPKAAREILLKTTFAQDSSDQGHFNKSLDELEAMMIQSYVGEGYIFIHAANSGGKMPKFAKKMIEILDRGLGKLPNHEGFVYHGNANIVADSLKVGQKIRFTSYVSTSLYRDTAQSFANWQGGEGTVFKIKVKRGKDLSQTFNSGESEVLMPRGFQITVTGRIEEDGMITVLAEQL